MYVWAENFLFCLFKCTWLAWQEKDAFMIIIFAWLYVRTLVPILWSFWLKYCSKTPNPNSLSFVSLFTLFLNGIKKNERRTIACTHWPFLSGVYVRVTVANTIRTPGLRCIENRSRRERRGWMDMIFFFSLPLLFILLSNTSLAWQQSSDARWVLYGAEGSKLLLPFISTGRM